MRKALSRSVLRSIGLERTYRLDEAAEALRHLIEDRPFGGVVLVG